MGWFTGTLNRLTHFRYYFSSHIFIVHILISYLIPFMCGIRIVSYHFIMSCIFLDNSSNVRRIINELQLYCVSQLP